MISHFGELKKKERANEKHKLSLRNKLRKIKENYIGYGKNSSKNYEFPKMTENEMALFKEKWRKKRKREGLKTRIIILISIIFGISIALYLRFYVFKSY